MKTHLPGGGLTALSVDFGADKPVRLSEAGARVFVDLLRSVSMRAKADGGGIEFWMNSPDFEISFRVPPDNGLALAAQIESGLSVWAARRLGKPTGTVSRYMRDAAKEITEVRTSYQY